MGGKNENTRLMVWNLSEQLQKQTAVVKTMLEQIVIMDKQIKELQGKGTDSVKTSSVTGG